MSSVSRSIVPDVVVIGGGIVGTAAAAVLAEAGAVVTLVERTGIGAGASGRNSGVVQHPFDRALRELHLESVAAYRTLAADADLGFAFPVEPAGLLLVGLDPAGPRRMAADLAATWPELRPAFLDAAAVSRLEPALAPDVSACRLELGYPVPPAAATRAMARLAERHGARLLVGQAATGIVRVGNRATGVRLADATSVPAGAVLVAAGPWSPELVDPTGAWRPIRPVWGVVVDVALGAPPRHVLEEADMDEALGDVAATTPDRGSGAGGAGVFSDGPDVAGDRPEFSLVTAAGRSTLGSTFLELEPDPAPWLPRLVARGRRFVPALADAPLGAARVCARPVAIDGRPLIGRVPGLDGAFIAAGHGPWGISTGPASGRRVADLILGRGAGVPLGLDPARFGAPG